VDATTLLRDGFRDLHEAALEALAGISEAELFWQPSPGANHCGYIAWHLVRDEEVMVDDVLGPGFARDDWASRLGLDFDGRGSAMDVERAAAMRYRQHDLLAYAERTWQLTDAAIAAMDPADFERVITWPDGTAWSVAKSLVTGSLCHGWLHAGELNYIRGIYRERGLS
jgi:hypothetical protein